MNPVERRLVAERAILAEGYDLIYVDYCEDADTPGLLGQIAGVTDHNRRLVKIGRVANPWPWNIAETLEHELRHIREPDWDCGSRDVLGRGGPRGSRS